MEHRLPSPIDAKKKKEKQSEIGKLEDDDGPTYLMCFLCFTVYKFFPVVLPQIFGAGSIA